MVVLKRERTIIDEMVELAQKETEVLRKDDIQGLVELSDSQQQISTELAGLEQERRQLEIRLAAIYCPDIKEATVSGLMRCAGQNIPKGFHKLVDGLKKSYQQLQTANDTNKLLIRQSLSYINKMVSVLLPSQETTYKQSGTVSKVTASRLDQTV